MAAGNTDIVEGLTVKFTYTRLDDTETITIDRLDVDMVYTSAAGDLIITGYLDEEHETARSFRADRIREIEFV